MAEFPALPLWTDAYLADTRHLSTLEHGAYLLLLMEAWRRPTCTLPDDDRLLSRLAGLSMDDWQAIKPTVMEFWKRDGRTKTFAQKRLSAEAMYVRGKSKTAKDAAAKRWNKTKKGDANALPTSCETDAPTPTPTIEEEGRESPRAREPESTLPANLSDAVPSDLSDMQKLAAECARTAGTRQIDPVQFGKDITLCREWTAAGADPPLILQTIREGVAASAKPIFSLAYFDQPIRTAVAKRKALENGTDPSPRSKPVDEVASRALERMAARRTPGSQGGVGLPGRRT